MRQGLLAALAVAVGVGAAMVTTADTAWADETGTGSDASDSPQASTSDDEPDGTEDEQTDDPAESTEDEPETQEPDESTEEASSEDDVGGDDGGGDDGAGADAATEIEAESAPTDLTAPEPPVDAIPAQQDSPVHDTGTDRRPGPAMPSGSDVSDLAAEVARQTLSPEAVEEGTAVIGVLTIDEDGAQSSFTQHSVVTTLDEADSDPAPDPLAPLLDIPATLWDVAVDVTVTVLRPLIEPGTTLDNALLWGVLAWTRREADRALDQQGPEIAPHSVSLTVTPTG